MGLRASNGVSLVSEAVPVVVVIGTDEYLSRIEESILVEFKLSVGGFSNV